jgi:hypothetical protein
VVDPLRASPSLRVKPMIGAFAALDYRSGAASRPSRLELCALAVAPGCPFGKSRTSSNTADLSDSPTASPIYPE